jgi:hypothetical protein
VALDAATLDLEIQRSVVTCIRLNEVVSRGPSRQDREARSVRTEAIARCAKRGAVFDWGSGLTVYLKPHDSETVPCAQA